MPTPGSVETAFGSVWVANGPSATVTRLDPRTNAVIARIPTPDPASVVGVGAGAIWLTSFPGNSLTRIDPQHNRVTRTISLAPGGAGPIGVTVFDGFVWVANHNGEPTTSVSKIDPATMRVVDVIPVGAATDAGPVWILSSAGSIWTNVNSDPNVVVRIDPHTDRILATIPAPSACAQLAADDTAVWGAGGDDSSCPPGVNRIDTHTNTVTATIRRGRSGRRSRALPRLTLVRHHDNPPARAHRHANEQGRLPARPARTSVQHDGRRPRHLDDRQGRLAALQGPPGALIAARYVR